MFRKKNTLFKLLSFSLIFLFFSMLDTGTQVKAAQVKTAVLKFGKVSGAASNVGKGDNDVGSKKNEKTYWELKVELVPKDKDSTGEYKAIDAVYVYTVKEDKKDYTHLEHRGTFRLNTNFTFANLEGTTTQTVSGYITGQQHDLVSVSVPANGIVANLWVKIDSSKGDDRPEIYFEGNLNVKYATNNIDVPPVITKQPENVTTDKSTATFTVTATGNPAPTYQWQISKNDGASWENIKNATMGSTSAALFGVVSAQGATTNSMSISVTFKDNSKFRCVVTNSGGVVNSNAATLKIILPTITQQPQSVTVTRGSTHTFSVTATDATAYKWEVASAGKTDWSDAKSTNWYSGYTTNKLTVKTQYTADGYTNDTKSGLKYRCIVMNSAASATTNEVTLTIGSSSSSSTQATSGTDKRTFTRTTQFLAPDYHGMDTWTTAIGVPAGSSGMKVKDVKNTSNYTLTIYEIVTNKTTGKKSPANPVKVDPGKSISTFNGRSELGITLYINGLIPDNNGNLSKGWVTIEYGWGK